MTSFVEINNFLANSRRDPIYSHQYVTSYDAEPVPIGHTKEISNEQANSIIERYHRAGFCIAEIRDEEITSNTLIQLANRLALGSPFVPPQYASPERRGLYEESGVNFIYSRTSGQYSTHRAFETNAEQKLHSDGTIQEIGLVQTSVLACVNAGSIGGDSTIFNSVAAFVELARSDQTAALSLLDPRCLKRSDTSDPESFHIGPVFALKDKELLSRYSIDNTSDWSPGISTVEHLARAYSFLLKMAIPDSGCYLEIRLKAGQVIIMANDKISHGRTAYTDTGSNTRKMIRGLFLERPSS